MDHIKLNRLAWFPNSSQKYSDRGTWVGSVTGLAKDKQLALYPTCWFAEKKKFQQMCAKHLCVTERSIMQNHHPLGTYINSKWGVVNAKQFTAIQALEQVQHFPTFSIQNGFNDVVTP